MAVSGQAAAGAPHIVRSALSAAELSAPLEIVVSLKMRSFAELQARVQSKQIVSAAELESKYLPSRDDYDRIAAWLTSQGLVLTLTDTHHTNLCVRGSVAQFAQAFGTNFARVATTEGEFTSAVTVPSLPTAVSSPVLSIAGLQPHIRRRHSRINRIGQAAVLASPNGAPTPGAVAAAYDVPANLDGTGQTIAILGRAVPLASDLTKFWSDCGISQNLNNFQVVNVAGGPFAGAATDEATLDVEWSSSMAPGAVIRLYAAPDYSSSSFVQSLTQIANDVPLIPGLQQVSISIGGPENQEAQALTTGESQAYMQLAALGVTVLVASGDGGSNPDQLPGTGAFRNSNYLTPEYPASDPNVTGVGGTSLSFNADWTKFGETTWFRLASAGAEPLGTGGGLSRVFPRPSWQTGFGVPGQDARCVPDVSAQADLGYFVSGGVASAITGTSMSTPIWAAIAAMLNQARSSSGLPPLGALNPWLYPLLGTNAFHDITTGNNGAYGAGWGYDLCTGLGTPDVANLVSAIASPTPAAPAITQQPSSQTVAANGTATLSGKATGTPNPAYQWYFNGTPILGANSPSITLANAAPVAAGSYSLTAMNSVGVATTAAANLTVTAAPLGPNYAFSSLAGSPVALDHVDGTRTAARFFNASSVALDAAGNVFVADSNDQTIRKITPAGIAITFAGTSGVIGSNDGPGNIALFNSPFALTVDSAGNVFVADTYNHTIRKITPDGTVSTLAGAAGFAGDVDATGSDARFNQPFGITVDPAGSIYVADFSNNTIRKITSGGSVSTLAGTSGLYGSTDANGVLARFDGPTAVAIDRTGNVYVADWYNQTIRKISPSGGVSTIAGSPRRTGTVDGIGSGARFNYPAGIAADATGNVFVADSRNDTIRQVAPDGTVTTIAGGAGHGSYADATGTAARFYDPTAIAVDSSGILWIADRGNHRIREVFSGGVVTTFAGTAGAVGSTDGVGPSSRFFFPDGVARDSAGTLYVTDSSNSTVRKVGLDGTVTTLAGSPLLIGSVDDIGANARFNHPDGIALGANGTLYVADTQNDTVRTITPDGNVVTLAGSAGKTGTQDGTGAAARFNLPGGIASDGAGNFLVADTSNYTIRKITPGGVVTTVAGTPGIPGFADGVATTAQFSVPTSVAVDAAGNIYVADYGNSTIRKITPSGIVSTFAGTADQEGSTDGTGAAARFARPYGLVIDRLGNLFVSDLVTENIRKITPAGVVTTVQGTLARFFRPGRLAIDAAETLYVPDAENHQIAKGLIEDPVVLASPSNQGVAQNSSVVFSASVAGMPTPAYQWYHNGVAVPGATGAQLLLSGVTLASAGAYTLTASNSFGTATTTAGTLGVTATGNPGRLINLSVLSKIQGSLSMGFVVGGSGTAGSESLLIRGVGPALGLPPFNVPGVMIDPTLTLVQQSNHATVVTNAGWGTPASNQAQVTATDAAVGAFALSNTASLDSAVVSSLPVSAGGYTATVAAKSGGGGYALTEVYDATPAASYTVATPRLVNLSCLTQLPTGGVLTVGFVIGGTTAKTVLARVSGPTLGVAPFGIPGTMPDPDLTVQPLSNASLTLASNAGWKGDSLLANVATSVGAFAFAGPTTLDSAVLVTLAPNVPYTVQATSASGAGGWILVEIYEIP